MPDSAVAEIEKLTGKKMEGSRVILDINAVRHISNRHGENGKQDQSMKNIEDIARMGYVIMNYDDITYDGITTTGYLDEKGQPSPMIKISKRINGTYYVIETVNSSKKKRSYVVSAFIAKKESSDLIPDKYHMILRIRPKRNQISYPYYYNIIVRSVFQE